MQQILPLNKGYCCKFGVNFYFLNSQSGHSVERDANSLVTSDQGPKIPDTELVKAALDIASKLKDLYVLLVEVIKATAVDSAHQENTFPNDVKAVIQCLSELAERLHRHEKINLEDIELIEETLKTLKNQAHNFPEKTGNVITIIQEIEVLLYPQKTASLLKELYRQNYSENQFDCFIPVLLILSLYELVRFCLRDDYGRFGANTSSQEDNEIIKLISSIVSFIDMNYIHKHGFINLKIKKYYNCFMTI